MSILSMQFHRLCHFLPILPNHLIDRPTTPTTHRIAYVNALMPTQRTKPMERRMVSAKDVTGHPSDIGAGDRAISPLMVSASRKLTTVFLNQLFSAKLIVKL